MNRFFVRIGVLLLSMIAFSCVGAALLPRFVPANQLQLEHWILLFTICALVSLPMGLFAPIGKKQKDQPEETAEPEAVEEQPAGEQEAPAEPQAEPTLAQLAAAVYLERLEELPPMEQALDIPAYSLLFYPKGHMMRHLLWADAQSLIFFPDGQEIGRLGESLQDIDLFRQMLRPLRIARGSIQFYLPLEALDGMDPMVLLRYQDDSGDPALLMLGRSALALVEELLPGYDLNTRLDKQYPSSHRQIDDIRSQLQELKELWLGDLITEEEYADKKAELLVKL